MDITLTSHVADIVLATPAAIKVFQHHHIDFCCGGKVPLAEVCEQRGIDPDALMAELEAAQSVAGQFTDWWSAPIADLVAHIQTRYHIPLRTELPRLAGMLTKVIGRHGAALPDILPPLQTTYACFQDDLIDHMEKEDAILFPAIIDADQAGSNARGGAWSWIEQPMDVMVAEHETAGAALASMREITRGYAPPEGACPTFRGLYFGLAELEREMHVHVHLENHVLFPRVAQLVREA